VRNRKTESAQINVAIVGAAGRIGRALVRCSQSFPRLRIAAAIERAGHPDLGRDSGTLAGLACNGVAITDSLDAIGECDVVIDFSAHSSLAANLAAAKRLRKPYVLGTTGLTPEEIRAVRGAARSIPVLRSPNMSVGMNLLFELVRRAAASLGPQYDAEIVEMHHRHKKDSPSGTALKLAEKLAEGRKRSLAEIAIYGRKGDADERKPGELCLHAVRGGDIVGDHRVLFAADGEMIELCHRATNRDTFAMGALRAASWLHGRKPGLYDMTDVLRLNED